MRKLCPDCKKKAKALPELKNLILRELDSLPENQKRALKLNSEIEVFEPQGCKKCNATGFSGRTGLFEVLEMTESLAEVVLKEPSESRIYQEALSQGMMTMRQDGILKVLAGLTTLEEVLGVAEEK